MASAFFPADNTADASRVAVGILLRVALQGQLEFLDGVVPLFLSMSASIPRPLWASPMANFLPAAQSASETCGFGLAATFTFSMESFYRCVALAISWSF